MQPMTVVSEAEPLAEPFASVTRRPTIPPPTTAPPVTAEAVMLRALDVAVERLGDKVGASPGKGGPAVIVLLVAILILAGSGVILWGRHMTAGDRQILDRLDALEQAHDDRIDHDQWVVDALQALSHQQPLPPAPRPARRRLAQAGEAR